MATVNPGGTIDPGGSAVTGTGTSVAAVVSDPAAVVADPAGLVADPGSVLAFTGSGPGTLVLTLVGILSLVAGGVLAALGVRRRIKHNAELPDLSHLAETGT